MDKLENESLAKPLRPYINLYSLNPPVPDPSRTDALHDHVDLSIDQLKKLKLYLEKICKFSQKSADSLDKLANEAPSKEFMGEPIAIAVEALRQEYQFAAETNRKFSDFITNEIITPLQEQHDAYFAVTRECLNDIDREEKQLLYTTKKEVSPRKKARKALKKRDNVATKSFKEIYIKDPLRAEGRKTMMLNDKMTKNMTKRTDDYEFKRNKLQNLKNQTEGVKEAFKNKFSDTTVELCRLETLRQEHLRNAFEKLQVGFNSYVQSLEESVANGQIALAHPSLRDTGASENWVKFIGYADVQHHAKEKNAKLAKRLAQTNEILAPSENVDVRSILDTLGYDQTENDLMVIGARTLPKNSQLPTPDLGMREAAMYRRTAGTA